MSNYKITVNGVTYDVTVEGGGLSPMFASPMMSAPAAFAPAAPAAAPAAPAAAPKAAPAPAAAPKAAAPAGDGKNVEAQVIGKIFKIVAKVGDAVEAGDEIVILESMKMEIPVVAPEAGTVASINVKEGDSVEVGDVIATLS